MAERRMFARSVIDSDLFLGMPPSTQMLYFHLAMRADDDGFINNPKRITNFIGAKEDDLRILIAKQFVLIFASGVIVIRHWKLHNYIRSDRYHPSNCEEKAFVRLNKSNIYELTEPEPVADTSVDTSGIPVGIPSGRQDGIPDGRHDGRQAVSIGKVRLGKVRLEKEKVKKEKAEGDVFDTVEHPELKKTLQDFEKMRRAIKKPLTCKAKILCLQKLQSLSEDVDTQIKIVEQSILNGWQGLFPLKYEGPPPHAAPKNLCPEFDGMVPMDIEEDFKRRFS